MYTHCRCKEKIITFRLIVALHDILSILLLKLFYFSRELAHLFSYLFNVLFLLLILLKVFFYCHGRHMYCDMGMTQNQFLA